MEEERERKAEATGESERANTLAGPETRKRARKRRRTEGGGKRPREARKRRQATTSTRGTSQVGCVRSKGTKASAGVGRWRKSADRGLIKTESGGHGRVA